MTYTTTYKNVLKWRNQFLREFLRSNILRLLSIGKNPDKKFKGVQFLYFHYIYDDEIENAKKSIKWINNNYNVISFSEAVRRIKENDIDDYYICFSSDDGLQSNLIASKILKKHNISCCFFINPATIENRDVKFHHKVCTERLGVPLSKILTWDEVNILVKDGHEIGNHSFDHKIQGDLSYNEFIEDLEVSTSLLKQKGLEINHYAFPRGLYNYFNKSYLEEVYKHGYLSCSTAVRGCHIEQQENVKLNEIAFRRDVLVFYEPIYFIKYFLKRAQRKAKRTHSFWPS